MIIATELFTISCILGLDTAKESGSGAYLGLLEYELSEESPPSSSSLSFCEWAESLIGNDESGNCNLSGGLYTFDSSTAKTWFSGRNAEIIQMIMNKDYE
jgi:hypothetical protein